MYYKCEKKIETVHPSLKKGRKSVFMVSLAQSKKTSNYHSALHSGSFVPHTRAPAPSHSLLVDKFATKSVL